MVDAPSLGGRTLPLRDFDCIYINVQHFSRDKHAKYPLTPEFGEVEGGKRRCCLVGFWILNASCNPSVQLTSSNKCLCIIFI